MELDPEVVGAIYFNASAFCIAWNRLDVKSSILPRVYIASVHLWVPNPLAQAPAEPVDLSRSASATLRPLKC